MWWRRTYAGCRCNPADRSEHLHLVLAQAGARLAHDVTDVETVLAQRAVGEEQLEGPHHHREGQLIPVPLSSVLDVKSGRPAVRWVNVNADSYRSARSFMTRLDRQDYLPTIQETNDNHQ